MKISDLLSMCIKNLTRRSFRTAMTVVGVVIGTSAIISMISLGIGINQSTSDFISSWGDIYNIEVWQQDSKNPITDETLQQLLAIDGVEAATPFTRFYYSGRLQAGRNGRYRADEIWNLVGVYPEALDAFNYTLSEGSPIKAGQRKLQLVAGPNVAYNFRDSNRKGEEAVREQMLDETGKLIEPFFQLTDADDMQLVLIYYDDEDEKQLVYDVEVVGMLSDTGEHAMETQESIFMDVRDMAKINEDFRKMTKDRNREPASYSEVRLRAEDLDQITSITDELATMNLGYFSQEEQRQRATSQTQIIQIILGSLGGISLFVAAISIANTMVMSVYERTREIGVMKVLGCYVRDIRLIFLVEASLIGFVGGVLGVGLSYLISFLLNRYGKSIGEALGMMSFGDMSAQISIIPPWLVLLGLGFAVGVGIISGLYPAYRAVRISALEAIKQE